jgi:hypothetical protein
MASNVDEPTLVNPPVELPRVEALVPARFERALELMKIQLGHVHT